MNTSRLFKKKIETIDSATKPPAWESPIIASIAKTREEAIERDKDDESDIRIYTDGSGQNGMIGAAAILWEGTRPEMAARKCLGPATKHTVFEGECIGQLLGLQLLNERAKTLRNKEAIISIAVDNQASLKAHEKRKQQPGSYIINEIQKEHINIMKKHKDIKIKYRWVPGHENIPGSERVDSQAKKAATGSEEDKGPARGILKKDLPASKAAIRQELKKRIKIQSKKAFKKSPRYDKITAIDPSMPSPNYRKFCKRIPRRSASILIQLRTGHVPLAAYLHRFTLADSPTCQQCKMSPETPIHYIKQCRAYHEQRRKLKTDIGPDKDVGLDLLGDKNTIRHILRYIKNTGRFEDSHGNVEIPEEQEEPTRNDEQDDARRNGIEWA